MMPDTYSLPPRQARICRAAAIVFLMCAVLQVLGAVTIAVWPGLSINCMEAPGCRWTNRPVRMLEEDEAQKVRASPAAERTFDAYAMRPVTRAGSFAVLMIEMGPLALLLLGIGMALRHLGGAGAKAIAWALPWLRRASLAAMAWAIGSPLSDSLLASLLSPGTPSGPHLYINVDLVDVTTGLLFGVAAFATIWALEAGLRAKRDLDEFV